MKPLKIFLFLAFLPLWAWAQPYYGQQLVGGSLAFSTINSSNEFQSDLSTINLEFNPRWGIMVSNRGAIIFRPTITYRETSMEDFFVTPGRQTTNGFGAQLAYRSFFPLGLGLGFSLEPYIGFRWEKGSQLGNFGSIRFVDVESNIFQIGLRPGFYYFLSKRFAIEASMGVLEYFQNRSEVSPEFGGQTNCHIGGQQSS